VIGRAAIAEIVAETGMSASEVQRLAGKGVPAFLEHCILCAEVREICQRFKPEAKWLSEVECRHEFSLRSARGTEQFIFKPDGALLSIEAEASVCFFEIDRGCVGIRQFEHACRTYARYFASSALQTHYESRRGLAACVTTGGERRIRHLMQAAERANLPMRFATFQELRCLGPDAPIWRLNGLSEPHGLDVEVQR